MTQKEVVACVQSMASNPHSCMEWLDVSGAFVVDAVGDRLTSLLRSRFEHNVMVKVSSRSTRSGVRFLGDMSVSKVEEETQRHGCVWKCLGAAMPGLTPVGAVRCGLQVDARSAPAKIDVHAS